jgi:hypothetical protein
MSWSHARPRTRCRGLLAALALSLLCFGSAAALAAAQQQTKKHHHVRKHHVRPHPVYWGAWIGDHLTGTAPPWDMNAVSRYEEIIGKRVSLLEFSSPFQDCSQSPCHFFKFPTESMEKVRQHGAIPFFSWGSESAPRSSPQQADFQLSDLIEGRYDAYITEFAHEAAAWGHPFFLRFDWEMNGNWFPWSEPVNGNSPGQFIAAWRHVHDLFYWSGATNVTWVWCPYADPNGRFQKLRSIYPGSAYVDWTCLDAYNWGLNGVNSQPWRSFDRLMSKPYEQLTKKVAPHKPIVLAEFASAPNGGHKALWIKNMFAQLPRKYPRVRGLIWFETLDRGINWPVTTSLTATRQFSRWIHKWYYLENGFSELAESPIRPLR